MIGNKTTYKDAMKIFDEAMCSAPEDKPYNVETYYLEITVYREGTWGLFSGNVYSPDPVQQDSTMIMDIKVDGRRLQIKFTNPLEWQKLCIEDSTVIDYVAVDNVFYNPKDF